MNCCKLLLLKDFRSDIADRNNQLNVGGSIDERSCLDLEEAIVRALERSV